MDTNVEQLIYEFLDRDGVSNLSRALLTKVNSRIQERIVADVTETSDENHVPSAKAVYTAINRMTHIKFKTHTGSIDTVVEPNPSFIYLQRDDLNDSMWMMYVYDEETGWINVGDTEVDLSNYWSKKPEDIEALKLALGITAEFETLVNNINSLRTDVDSLKDRVDGIDTDLSSKVDQTQMVKLTDEEIMAAVDEAYTATTPAI